MIKLSPLTMSSIEIGAKAHNGIEWSDKALFEYIYKDYKSVDKGSRGQVSKLINTHIELTTKSINVQNALKRVARLAFNYVDMQVICKFDSVEYSNIRALVVILKHIDKNFTESSKLVRNGIKSLYETGMSTHRYNGVIVEHIKQLKAKYKVNITDDDKVIEVNYESVASSVSKLSVDDKLKLLEMLQVELAYDEVA